MKWFNHKSGGFKPAAFVTRTPPSNNATIPFILWILAFFFLIRLIGITNPPLEIGHSWRQALTNMVARNFLETDANIFFPRIDIAGEKTGIMGAEFPIFNYLIYLASAIFGYQHWYGRLINLIVSTIGLYYFFLFIKELFNRNIANYATIILLVSVWFDFSRKAMPDTFSVALVLIGFYQGYCYLKNGKTGRLLLFFGFITLGVLSKLSALSLLSFLLIPLLIKEIPLHRKIGLTVTASVSFGLICAWYFYWVPYLAETYGYMLYFPRTLAQGATEVAGLWREAMEKFYFSAFHSYIAFGCFLLGLFFLISKDVPVLTTLAVRWFGFLRRLKSSIQGNDLQNYSKPSSRYFLPSSISIEKKYYLKIGLFVFSFIFFLFILKTGEVFPLHNYYIIPFTPIMALIAALALVRMKPLYAYLLLIAIGIEAIANQQHEFFIKDSERHKLRLENIADQVTQATDLIIINDGARNPQQIYFAHRKGWTVNNEDLNAAHIRQLQELGATYLFIDKNSHQKPLDYTVAYDDEHYCVYRLK